MSQILITGTNRGIGRELTKQYLENGDSVVGCNRQHSEFFSKTASYQEILFDLNIAESIEKAKKQIRASQLDVVILNASENLQLNVPLINVNKKLWLKEFGANVIGNLLLVENLKDLLLKSSRSKVIFISSNSASITNVSQGGNYPYRTTKAALNAVMKLMSEDLRNEGIITAAIAPGRTKTRMGGDNASFSVENSAQCIRAIIDNLEIQNSGAFFARDGSVLPF